MGSPWPGSTILAGVVGRKPIKCAQQGLNGAWGPMALAIEIPSSFLEEIMRQWWIVYVYAGGHQTDPIRVNGEKSDAERLAQGRVMKLRSDGVRNTRVRIEQENPQYAP